MVITEANKQATCDLVNSAYTYLKKKIISCEFEPGQSIVENDISLALNISRTPIRSALRQLESEQLVRLIPNKGALVTDVSVTDIEELFEFRTLLEIRALRNYVQYASDAQIAEFYQTFERYQGMKNFSEEYHDEDSRFHSSIVKYIRNSRMLTTYYQLCDQINRLRHIAALDPSRAGSTPQEHIEILKWIQIRDAENAEKAMIKHLEAVKMSVMNSFKNVYWSTR